MCVRGLHIAVSYVKLLSVAQLCFCGNFISSGKNKMWLGLHVDCPVCCMETKECSCARDILQTYSLVQQTVMTANRYVVSQFL